MEQEDIIEGNVLIAEFLGYKWPSSDIYTDDEVKHLKRYEISEMKFHSSWNHLMPVVEEIMNDISVRSHLKVHIRGSLSHKINIDKTWLAVVEFIKWYNQNTG